METISRIKLSRIRVEEYPTFFYQLLNVFDGVDAAGLFINRTFTNFQGQKSEVDKIVSINKDTSDTKALVKSDELRDAILLKLWDHVEGVSKLLPNAVFSSTIIENAQTVLDFLKRFGRSTTNISYSAETERLREIKALFEGDQNLLSAVTALDLKSVFESLFSENEKFDSLYLARAKNTGATVHTDVRSIRTATDKAITALFNAIEYNVEEHPEVNYVPLISNLNALLVSYKALVEKRSADKKSPETAGVVK